jgi:hypothetical protein
MRQPAHTLLQSPAHMLLQCLHTRGAPVQYYRVLLLSFYRYRSLLGDVPEGQVDGWEETAKCRPGT